MKVKNNPPPRFAEIKTYQDKDDAHGITTSLVRHLIATAVSQTTLEIYQDDAPEKCMQSSAGVKRLLSRLGISSRMVAGAVCYLKIDARTKKYAGWSGFWGSRHHFWTVTQYNEIVDISISMLNMHKMTIGSELAPPALWWPMSLGSPHFFRYLWDINCSIQEFEGKEASLFSNYMEALDNSFDDLCENLSPDQFEYPDLLGGEGELRRSLDNKHPYLSAVIHKGPQTSPLPDWIIDRQIEIKDAARKGEVVKSRLMDVDGLFKVIKS